MTSSRPIMLPVGEPSSGVGSLLPNLLLSRREVLEAALDALMTGAWFGTDGLRGRVTDPILHPVVVDLLAEVMATMMLPVEPPVVLMGDDTRASAAMLKQALGQGFARRGWRVIDVGVVPTPALAYLTATSEASLGVMISASHNPPEDNGLKVFDAHGQKISPAHERSIEEAMRQRLQAALSHENNDVTPTKAVPLEQQQSRLEGYRAHLMTQVPPVSLRGWRVVVDGANGAGAALLPDILRSWGADVVALGCAPNGANINIACGSTHPNAMQQAVRDHQAHVGVSLDGDGDRLVMCDDLGALVDGDGMLACLVRRALARGTLKPGNTVVGTVMSNGGFERDLAALGVRLHRAPVGDRFVLDAMRQHAACLGGEPSGHIILGADAATGDGLLTALHMLAWLAEAIDQTATPSPKFGDVAQALQLFSPWPQQIVNVRTQSLPRTLLADRSLAVALDELQQAWADRTHAVVRASGTERLVRVMVQGEATEDVEALLNALVRCVVEADAGQSRRAQASVPATQPDER